MISGTLDMATEDREFDNMEQKYLNYFTPNEEHDFDDDNNSLQQPSHLKIVDSFTTYGVSDDLIVTDKGAVDA